MFWYQIKKDGSIYLGPRLENVTSMRTGAKRTEHGSLTISYEEGQEIKDPALLKGKISFHASGVIHGAGSRSFREPIRDISKQEELCRVLFAHPSTFDTITDIRKKDICLNYPHDEGSPLQAIFFIAPRASASLVRVNGAVYQINLLFPFSSLEGVPDLLIQFILFHSSSGAWPPYTYLIFGTVAARQPEG